MIDNGSTHRCSPTQRGGVAGGITPDAKNGVPTHAGVGADEEEILRRLVALNLARANAQGV